MSIHFQCPHCGLVTDVDEKFRGTSGSCVRCGKAISIPSFGDPSAKYSSHLLPARKTNWPFVIIILAGLAVIGLSVGAIIVNVWIRGQRASQRIQCQNNQQEIAQAISKYVDVNHHFPPAYIADKNGKPMHSWRVLILPYLDKGLFSEYHMDEPWDGPHNKRLADKMPDVYRCPANTDPPNCTSYFMLTGPHAISNGGEGRSLRKISDGLIHTLMIAESADANINWLEPRDLNVEEMSYTINKNGKEISSHHPHGAVATLCNGHPLFLNENTQPSILKALTTIDGNEQIDEEEFNTR